MAETIDPKEQQFDRLPLATDYLVPLDGMVSEDTARFGGKGQSIHRMVRAGFNVPRAWCLTAEAYHQFMTDTGIEIWIKTLETIDLPACKRIRNLIHHTPLPPELHEQVVRAWEDLGRGAVAVRSSGLREDGSEQSWAGQHDSFLYVRDEDSLSAAVQRCWGSIWADRAYTYREHYSGAVEDMDGIAVVIQEMVDADSAGIAFSADPVTGDDARILIDACFGSGEGAVSGQVVTDSWTVDAVNWRIVRKKIRPKPTMISRHENGGTQLSEVPPDMAERPALSDEMVLELAAKVHSVKKYYGQDMDVEWALADGRLWFLQARPITVTPHQGEKLYACVGETDDHIRENAFFSRLDAGEIMTGLMSPLGLSFCRHYQHNVHGQALKRLGLLHTGNPDHHMGYLQGHVYLNVSNSALLLSQCPPTRDQMISTRHYATDEVDLSHYCNPYGEPPTGLAYVRSALYWLGCQLRRSFIGEREVREAVQLRRREMARFLELDLSAMTLPELNLELQRIDRHFLRGCEIYLPLFFQSFALYDALAALCDQHLEEEGAGLQNRLKAYINNLRTVDITRGIRDLAENVRAQPRLRGLIQQTPAEDLVSTLREDNAGRAFWEGPFADFLFEFGARGRQEFNLSQPRWYDDPTYLLQLIRMYLNNDIDLESRLAAVSDARTSDTENILLKLPLGTRTRFRMAIARYSKVAERREATRPTFLNETWFYRCILMEVLRRLEHEGVASPEDLPYVDFQRFRDYMAGYESAQSAFNRDLLEENRGLHESRKRLKEPPMSIIGGHTPELDTGYTEGTDDQTVTLKGVGASPGSVVARARVITNLDKQAEELRPGEILVAPYTDASWTPLLALAGGVVTDVGSLLSHSSIVSREFGVPAVVNAEVATRKIRTGDLVSLDGNSGIVKVE